MASEGLFQKKNLTKYKETNNIKSQKNGFREGLSYHDSARV
jgi:hypothetical protein